MLRKITEVWPDLIRAIRQPSGEEDSRPPSDGQESNEEERDDEMDRHQVLLEYKNMYWTRLMAVGDFETG